MSETPDIRCPVCMETQPESIQLSCHHHICRNCLFRLRRPQCPVCRQAIFTAESSDSDDEIFIEVQQDTSDLMEDLFSRLRPHGDEPLTLRRSPNGNIQPHSTQSDIAHFLRALARLLD